MTLLLHNTFRTTLCIIGAFLLCVSHAIATPHEAIKLTSEVNSLSIGKSIFYFEDADKSLSVEDVTAVSFQKKFQRSGQDRPNFGYSNSAFWVKIPLVREGGANDWRLELTYASLDYVDFFQKDDSNRWKRITVGDMVSFHERPIAYRYFIFPLDLPENKPTSIYLRIRTEGSNAFPLNIRRSEQVFQSQVKKEVYYGIFYGLMMVMMVYNLFIYFSLKDLNYLYYSCGIFFAVLYVATLHCHTYQYLWGSYPKFQNNIHLLSVFGWAIMAVLFTVQFLGIKKYTPLLRKYYLVLASLGALCILSIPFLSYSLLIKLGTLLVMIVCVSVIIGCVYYIFQGHRTAYFFTLAWTAYLIGNIVMAMRALGVLPDTLLTEHSPEIGASLEVVLISFALAERYKILRKEKKQVEERNREILQQANEELEVKVQERTKELQKKQKEVLAQNEELQQQQEEITTHRDYIEKKNSELEKQQDKLVEAYQNITILAEIGQAITATLDLEAIVRNTYQHVNQLMDASGFGIGLCRGSEILFKGYIEKGEQLPTHCIEANAEANLASWCVENQKEVFINDITLEYQNYLPSSPKASAGEIPMSILYLPLTVEQKVVGVITGTEFFQKCVYEERFGLFEKFGQLHFHCCSQCRELSGSTEIA